MYHWLYGLRLLTKISVFILIAALAGIFTVMAGNALVQTMRPDTAVDSEFLLSFPMKETNWKDLGVVSEPLVTLSVKTKNGYRNNTFLLDSGAVVSSLPREWADELGLDLAFLPRSVFGGFGGKTSIAYQADMVVVLGDEEVTLPVVLTEAAAVKSLLGRKGFFNQYSIIFDHKNNRVEIRK